MIDELKTLTDGELKRARVGMAERITEARRELGAARAGLLDLELEQVRREYGVEIGAVVVDVRGRECQVTKIRPWSHGGDLHGRLRKKNGEWGAVERWICPPWTVKEQADG